MSLSRTSGGDPYKDITMRTHLASFPHERG